MVDEGNRFGRFFVKRDRIRWRIFETGSDGIHRPIGFVGCRFWSWITAARLAQEFNRVRNDGEWVGGDLGRT